MADMTHSHRVEEGEGSEKPTLIHFNFCPFCHRVRLALGFERITYAETTARFYGSDHFLEIRHYDALPVLVYGDGTR